MGAGSAGSTRSAREGDMGVDFGHEPRPIIDEEKLADLIGRAGFVHVHLQNELHSRFVECYNQNKSSRASVCLLLGIRSSSMLAGCGLLQHPATLDSWDVLMRAHMEAINLFLDFRIVDANSDRRMKVWLKGKDAWKADHTKVEVWVKEKTGGDSRLNLMWGLFSKLTHPTHQACRNSVAAIEMRMAPGNQHDVLRHKMINYMGSLAGLIAVATNDDSGLVALDLDDGKMPDAEQFRLDCNILVPYLNHPPAKPEY